MSETTCLDCGHPQSEYANGQADYFCLSTGDVNCESRSLRRVRAELAAALLVIEAAQEVRSWYDKQMGPDGPEDDFDAALADFNRLRGVPNG